MWQPAFDINKMSRPERQAALDNMDSKLREQLITYLLSQFSVNCGIDDENESLRYEARKLNEEIQFLKKEKNKVDYDNRRLRERLREIGPELLSN